jgi:hypothetical protein
LVLLAPALPEDVRLRICEHRDLPRSPLQGNPVGILLLWRSGSPEDSDPFALRVLVGGGKSSENFLIVDGQQRVLSLLLLLNGWHVKVGDMEYSRQPISFNPTKYVLEAGRRGLDLS